MTNVNLDRLKDWIDAHSPASCERIEQEDGTPALKVGIYWSNTLTGAHGVEYSIVNTWTTARYVLGY